MSKKSKKILFLSIFNEFFNILLIKLKTLPCLANCYVRLLFLFYLYYIIYGYIQPSYHGTKEKMPMYIVGYNANYILPELQKCIKLMHKEVYNSTN